MNKFTRIKKQLVESKDGKTVFANFGYLSLLQIAGYVFPLITMPYLARVIGTEGFGKIAFASAVVVWFQTVADWGFNLTATRDVAQHRDDKEKVSVSGQILDTEKRALVLAAKRIIYVQQSGFRATILGLPKRVGTAWNDPQSVLHQKQCSIKGNGEFHKRDS